MDMCNGAFIQNQARGKLLRFFFHYAVNTPCRQPNNKQPKLSINVDGGNYNNNADTTKN